MERFSCKDVVVSLLTQELSQGKQREMSIKMKTIMNSVVNSESSPFP